MLNEKDFTKVKNFIIQKIDIKLLDYIFNDQFEFNQNDFIQMVDYMRGAIDTYIECVLHCGSPDDINKLYQFSDIYLNDSIKDMRNNYE